MPKNFKLEDSQINRQKGLLLIKSELVKYIPSTIVIILLLIITTLASVISPQIIKYAIDENISKNDLSGLKITTLFLVGTIIIAFITRYIHMRLTGNLGQKILFDLRKKVFTKIQSLPLRFFTVNQSGDIIQRVTSNVEGINSFFSEGIIRLLGTVFGIIIQLILMFVANVQLTLITIGGTVIIVIILQIFGKPLSSRIKKSLDLDGNLSSMTQEVLNGFRVISNFNRSDNWKTLFVKKNDKYFNATLSVVRLTAFSESLSVFVAYLTVSSVLFFSLTFYQQGIISQGSVILFITYEIMYFRQLAGFSELWKTIQTGIASAQRISELLEMDTNITNSEVPYTPKKKDILGKVEFNKVYFEYDDGFKVLEDIDFTVEAGKKIAIVGPTGGGKTTFVNLITRLYDVTSGKILIDGVNIKEWNLDTLRKNVGYLIQDSFLFEDTIFNNLRYNNPKITEEQVLKIFKDLGAYNLISSLKEGIHTKVNGNFSAGQRQIIALARVILRDPKILILDEATSRIDTKSEKLIQKAIDIATEGRTSFIIAHRLSTIFNADWIILIRDNKIYESGTHKDLLAKKGQYYEMYSKFVL